MKRNPAAIGVAAVQAKQGESDMKKLGAALGLVALLGAVVLTYNFSLKRYVHRAQFQSLERLEVYANLLLSRIERYHYLPYVISNDRTVLRLLEGRTDYKVASRTLKRFQSRSGAAVLYVLDRNGTTVASSNFDQPKSFVGNNYGFREYFKAARAGLEGYQYAIGATSGIAGFFLSAPIMLDGEFAGAAVVKLELSSLQSVWRAGGELVLASDPDGVVVLSTDREMAYRTLLPLPEKARARIRESGAYPGMPLTPMASEFGTVKGVRWVEVFGEKYLLARQKVEDIGWDVFCLTPLEDVEDAADKVTGLVFLLLLVLSSLALFLREHRLKSLSEERLAGIRKAREIDREREESLRLLADSIAHQIRNPLLTIGGNVNIIKRRLDQDDAALERYLEPIIDCCQDLDHLVVAVRQYIDLVPSQMRSFEMADVVSRAVSETLSRVSLPENKVHWRIDLASGALIADPDLLFRALVEVLENAVESGEGGKVRVEVAGEWKRGEEYDKKLMVRGELCYELTVTDDGSGIAPELIKNIADPFVTTKPHGSGLGLSKAKRVIQVFHGDFRIDSPAPGQKGTGTRVRIILPYIKEWEEA